MSLLEQDTIKKGRVYEMYEIYEIYKNATRRMKTLLLCYAQERDAKFDLRCHDSQ